MPDLKTALTEALAKKDLTNQIKQWDDEEKPTMNPNPQMNIQRDPATGKAKFGVSNNVMRASFESVKTWPGLTAMQHVALLAQKGFKESSTTSVLSQLVRAGQLRRDDERKLYIVTDEYQPMTTRLKAAKQMAKQAEVVPTPRKKVVLVKKGGNTHHSSVGIAALGTDGGTPPTLQQMLGAPKPKPFLPSAIVDQLTVLHARELYDYLKKIFGGN